jgi:hypothetical protein
MPFDIEGSDPPAGGDTPNNLAVVVDGIRGVFDVTVHSDGGAANSFDLYLPDPADAAGFSSTVTFYGGAGAGQEAPGEEGEMIVFVGVRPVRPLFCCLERA